MSIAFTTIRGTSFRTLIDELGDAYEQRCLSLGVASSWNYYSYSSEIATIILFLQTWLEAYSIYNPAAPYSFIDHINGPLKSDGSGFLNFTISTWRQAAGLNVNGFRRAKTWNGITAPMFEYGLFEWGDEIGPWIFEDLQKGFSALRWSMWSGNVLNSRAYLYAQAYTGGTCEDLLTAFDLQWTNAVGGGWQTDYPIMSNNGYVVHLYQRYNGGNGMTAIRQRGKAQIAALPVSIPRAADVYLNPVKSPVFFFVDDPGDFLDIDGLGVTENYPWYFESFSEFSDSSKTSNYLGNDTTNPRLATGANWACPVPGGYRAASCSFGTSWWLLKWNFTYQN